MNLRNRTLFSGAAIQEHYAHAVIDPDTGRNISYEDLIRNPKTRDLWSNDMTKELARLAQGIDGPTKGTSTVFYMNHDEIHNIPKDRTVTYAAQSSTTAPRRPNPIASVSPSVIT